MLSYTQAVLGLRAEVSATQIGLQTKLAQQTAKTISCSTVPCRSQRNQTTRQSAKSSSASTNTV